jgi:hypothetical protein
MVDVIKWPPVAEVAFEVSKIEPISTSTSLINNAPRQSRVGRSRRIASSSVSGIGYDAAGAGYMEVLKELLDGGVNLVRINLQSSIWHLVRAQNNPTLRNSRLEWLDGSTDLLWTTGGIDIYWWESAISATPTTDDGWFALTVTGLPPNMIVARPHENISVYSPDGSVSQTAKALTVARSNSGGVATIRLLTQITASGPCVIGTTESVVFRALELPRAIQPQAGDWQYEWNFVEAFADEYEGGFVEKNPW